MLRHDTRQKVGPATLFPQSAATYNPQHVSGGCYIRPGGSDREMVREFALRASGSARVAQCLVDLWQAQADDLMQARWAAVQRVAAALLEKQMVDGAELQRLVFMPTGSVGGTKSAPLQN